MINDHKIFYHHIDSIDVTGGLLLGYDKWSLSNHIILPSLYKRNKYPQVPLNWAQGSIIKDLKNNPVHNKSIGNINNKKKC